MIKDTRQRFTLRIPEELNKGLELEAKKQGLTRNSLILQILWEWSEDSNKSSIENPVMEK